MDSMRFSNKLNPFFLFFPTAMHQVHLPEFHVGKHVQAPEKLHKHSWFPNLYRILNILYWHFLKAFLERPLIICISILGEEYEYGSRLRDVLSWNSTNLWIMISRLSSDCAPVVIVLPIVSITIFGGSYQTMQS